MTKIYYATRIILLKQNWINRIILCKINNYIKWYYSAKKTLLKERFFVVKSIISFKIGLDSLKIAIKTNLLIVTSYGTEKSVYRC